MGIFCRYIINKLKTDHLICCINVSIEETGICSMTDTGERVTS